MKDSVFAILIIASSLILGSSCAYRLGSPERTIPGGEKRVSVPVFQNKSDEVGIETSFTNALIDELVESDMAQVNPASSVEIEGTIVSVDYFRSGQRTLGTIGKDKWGMATDYRVVIVVDLAVKRKADQKVFWSSQFTGERTFSAAQIVAPTVNSVNPIYNMSARRRNIAELAKDIMAEAADRMTENF